MKAPEMSRFSSQHSGALLLGSLMLFLASPIMMAIFPAYSSIVFAIIYSLLILTGMLSLAERRHHVWIGLVLGFFSLVFVWINLFSGEKGSWEVLMTVSLLIFLFFLLVRLFLLLIRKEEITIGTVYVSASGYLLIGIIGGLLFQALELALPGSFNHLSPANKIFDLHYLSFVTITSLGFGDITPANPASKSLTTIICVVGQLYLTILVAIIIGRYFK